MYVASEEISTIARNTGNFLWVGLLAAQIANEEISTVAGNTGNFLIAGAASCTYCK